MHKERFKSAVLKFRYLNRFEGFSESEQFTFKHFLKGLTNQQSNLVLQGQTDMDDSGKRHLKKEEYTKKHYRISLIC
jgi:hypothetical protein